eukprot:COSAG01_NODE_6056_length_3876_cov_9.951019_6_plen_55_part_00
MFVGSSQVMEAHVAELNAQLAAGTSDLPTRGPCSKYAITKADGEQFYGSLELTW